MIRTLSPRTLFLATATTALLLSGCNEGVRVTSTSSASATADSSGVDRTDNGVLKVIQTLQCPQTIGRLTRKGPLAENGRACTYTGPRGAEVTLQLITTEGQDIDRILAGFEARLKDQMPEAREALAARQAQAQAQAAPEPPRADTTAPSDAAPGVDVAATNEKAHVRLPGIRIDADGQNASVRIGGLHIDASDNAADININADGETVSIQAADRVAEVRARQSGEAHRASWSLNSEDASARTGLRRVGYEARGPASGPVVVASYRSRADDGDELDQDVRQLVSLNVGN